MIRPIISICIVLCIINLISSISISINFEGTEFKKINPDIVSSLKSPHLPGPSQEVQTSSDSVINKIVVNERAIADDQADQFPISVNKYITEHKIDANYTKDIICVLIHATNIGRESITDVDLYEIIPEDVIIINSSMPVKTSSIEEALRYERIGRSVLCNDDLSSPKELAKKLTASHPPCEISINFSTKDNDRLMNQSNTDDFIKNILIKKFNTIISNMEIDNQTWRIDNNYLSSQTKKLIEVRKDAELQIDDQRLLNFLLLRDIYPTHIKRIDHSIEILEKLNLERDAGLIHIRVPRWLPKESIIFKYYINVSNHLRQTATTIVGIPGEKYPYMQYPLDVTFLSPKFEVRGDYSSQKVQPDEEVSIRYIVTFLNPMNTTSNYSFNAFINNDTNIKVVTNPWMIMNFTADDYKCEIKRGLIFHELGTYNLPSLSINNNETSFGIDGIINVEPLWHTYILELTILFLAFCTLIGGNLHHIYKPKHIKCRLVFLSLLIIIIAIILLLCEWNIYFPIVFICSLFLFAYSCHCWLKNDKNCSNK